MRKLASIQKIKALEPIEGADAIEKATVLGWQLVVKKGEYKVGDLAIYCEIDSILPDRPEFEFMKPRNMRVRTIKLRGQVSQGICFPLSFLPEGFAIVEDADCTTELEIIKYELPIPACLSGIAKGRFPQFIPKTDEIRVQVFQSVLDACKGEKCYVTEKVDGSSATFYLNNGEFGVCSRNLELIEDSENSFWKFARQTDMQSKLSALHRNLALQGELVGESIQSNKLKLRGQTVLFFNAFDIDSQTYLDFYEFEQIISTLGYQTVPVIEYNYLLESDINTLVKKATIKSSVLADAWAEGIVIRSYSQNLLVRTADDQLVKGRLSFKVINPEFLLKYGE